MATWTQKIKKALSVYRQTNKKSAALEAFFFDDFGYRSDSLITLGLSEYGARAVRPESNSIVSAGLGWSVRNFRYGNLQMIRENRVATIIKRHRVLNLLENPNPYYTGEYLFTGLILSYLLDGNAYLVKVRNRNGRGFPVQLYFIPHLFMRPYFAPPASKWIDYYEYNFNGEYMRFAPENVIHIRNGMDLQNPRLGRAPLKSTIDEITTDENAAAFSGALMSNLGMPGLVVSPDSDAISIQEPDAKAIKEKFDRQTSGNKRGSTVVLSENLKVATLGFSLKDLEIGTVRHVPEQRVASNLGIPLEVLGLGSGKEASTFNNLTTFERIAFEQNLIPIWKAFAKQLSKQLLQADFEDDPDVSTGV
jgi:HK97 family phage portal protein